ncbi:MAG: AAA family ATPase [Telmatospirillum sp.]|nr:AAA family ATPase [Telmatospirillum sp.]
MKIAVTGKGGVGKSTLTGLLARAFADDGWGVLAIDADPDANLASAIGVPPDRARGLLPISAMSALARERTGAADTGGSHFILNPRVDDLPDRFAITHEGVKLLLMGAVEHAGAGCVCPEHALLRSLLKHILNRRRECVLLDMEAGVEHLGRGTAGDVDLLIVVVEPGARSIETARRIAHLAGQLGLTRIAHVASKVTGAADSAFIAEALGREVIGTLPFDPDIAAADRRGVSAYDLSPACRDLAASLRDAILDLRPDPTKE